MWHHCYKLLPGSVLIALLQFVAVEVNAQQNLLQHILDESHDSTYVISYAKFLTGRYYFSQKYTRLDLVDRAVGAELQYRPNTTLNMGVGATYGNFTLNLAYGFSFLNPDIGRGDTRWLDLQSHIYGRRFILDTYGQFYSGLYLRNTRNVINDPELAQPYILRPDIFLRQFGLAASYVFNSERFSYRASFVQNEWQKRSAGSFIVGFEIYSGLARGDSSLVPILTYPSGIFDDLDIRKMTFFEFGPSAGYAHTFVYKSTWFFTAHLSINPSVGWVSEYKVGLLDENIGLYPNVMSRAVVGYNSPQWFIGLSYINNSLRLSSSLESRRYEMETGNLRINLARRFVPGSGTTRYLRLLDNLKK